jgi:rhomboid protease GluP
MDYQTKMKMKRLMNQPFITYGLIGLTALIFLGMELTGGSESNLTLVSWGAMVRPYILQGHQFWRFFTPMFLHIGWMHIILNMITLYYVGSQIEAIYGHWRYLGIYLLSGIAGNVFSFGIGDSIISAGASTSIFGLFGAVLILGRYYKNNPAVSYLVKNYTMFIVVNLFFNIFSSSVDIMGHIGGLLGGLLSATALIGTKQSRDVSIHERIIAAMIYIFLIVICVLVGFKKQGLPV